VLLIDADPQKSSASWRALRESNDIVCTAITEPTLHKDVPTLASGYDLVVIDAGGRDSATFRSAVLAADILVIPVLPSQFDIFAATDTISILNEAKVYKETIKPFFVLNQLLTNSNVSRDAEEAMEELTTSSGIPLLENRLFARVAYKRSLETGRGVSEYEPDGKAAIELTALYKEIMRIGGKK